MVFDFIHLLIQINITSLLVITMMVNYINLSGQERKYIIIFLAIQFVKKEAAKK